MVQKKSVVANHFLHFELLLCESHSRCDGFPWGQSEVADRASRDASIVELIDKERDVLDALRFGCQGNQAQREIHCENGS